MGCFDGSGIVHHQGALDLHIMQGMACTLPRQSPNHFEISDSRRWTYAFVRYLEPRGIVPVANSDQPKVDDYDAAPLVQAIWGLHAEASSTGVPSALHLWVELIHDYVMQFTQPRNQDARVSHAWEQVASHLNYRWTLKEIAAANSMSTEHFRRLCIQSTRRSPMKHLTHLRMKRAVQLLTTTDLTIETIALEVGYEFASTFSNTFQRWSGRRPSEFRISNRLS